VNGSIDGSQYSPLHPGNQPDTPRECVQPSDEEAPDVICVQEHKLQESHVEDVVAKLRELLPEYPTVHFAVSTAKKGYSGVAVFARAPLAGAAPGGADVAGGGGASSSGGSKQQGNLLGFVSKAKPAPAAPAAPAAAAAAGAAKLLKITEGFGDFKPGYTDEGRVITLVGLALFQLELFLLALFTVILQSQLVCSM
jgi:exonuclease III